MFGFKKGVSSFARSLLSSLYEKYQQEWLSVKDQPLKDRLVLLNNPLFLAPDCWFDEAGVLEAKKADETLMRNAFANPGGMAHREPYKDFKLAMQARLAGNTKKPLLQYAPKELVEQSVNSFLLDYYIVNFADNPDPLVFALLLAHAPVNGGLVEDTERYTFAIKRALEELKSYCNQEENNQEHYQKYKTIVIELAAYLSRAYRDMPAMLADLSHDYRQMVADYQDEITARIQALDEQQAILAFIEFVKTCEKKEDLLAMFKGMSFAKVLGAACDSAGNRALTFKATIGDWTISAEVLKQTRSLWLPLYLEQQKADSKILPLLNTYFVLLEQQGDQQIIPLLIDFMKKLPKPSRFTRVVDFVRASWIGGKNSTVEIGANFFLPASIVQQMRSEWFEQIDFTPYKKLLESVLGELFVAVLQQQDEAVYQRFSEWVEKQDLQLMPHSDTRNYEQILQCLCEQFSRDDLPNVERKKIFSRLQDIFLPRIQLEKTKRLDAEKPITPLVMQVLVKDSGLMATVLKQGDTECAQALVEWIKALQLDLAKFLTNALTNRRALENPDTINRQARILDGWISALNIRVKPDHWLFMSDKMKAELSKFGRTEVNSEFHTVNIAESLPADLSEEQKLLFMATFQNRPFDVFVQRTKDFLLTRAEPNSQSWFAIFQKIVKNPFLFLLLEQLRGKPAVKKAAQEALYQLIQLWPAVIAEIIAMIKDTENALAIMGTAYLAAAIAEDKQLETLFARIIPATEGAVRRALNLADAPNAASQQVTIAINGYRLTLDRTTTIKDAEPVIKQYFSALQPFFECLDDYFKEEKIAGPKDLWAFVFSSDLQNSLLAALLKNFKNVHIEPSWFAIALLHKFIQLWPEIIIAFDQNSIFLQALANYPDLQTELQRVSGEKRKNHPVQFSADYSLQDALEISKEKAGHSIDKMFGVFTEGMQTIGDLDNADCFSVAKQISLVPTKVQPIAALRAARVVTVTSPAAAASSAQPARATAASSASPAAGALPSSEVIQQAYLSQAAIEMHNPFPDKEAGYIHFATHFTSSKKYTRDWRGMQELVKDLDNFMAITFAFGAGPWNGTDRITDQLYNAYSSLTQDISDIFAQLIVTSIKLAEQDLVDLVSAMRTLIALCPSILITPIKLNPQHKESATLLPVEFAKHCDAKRARAVLKSLESRPCKHSQERWNAVQPSFQGDVKSAHPVDFIAFLYAEILKTDKTRSFKRDQAIISSFAQAGLLYSPSKELSFTLDDLLRYGCFDRLMDLYLATKLANQVEQEEVPQATAAVGEDAAERSENFYPKPNNF